MPEAPLICHRCSAELAPGRAEFYVIRIEALADPSPPVFTEADLQRDHRREIAELVEAMSRMSGQEAMDQVYRRMQIYLCNACYQIWIENPTG